MNNKLDFGFLTSDTRARVYLLWAAIVGIGFSATHYHQENNINILWFILSVIGLGYMFRIMPLRVKQMQRIFFVWAAAIGLGFVGTTAILYLEGLRQYIGYLGAFWLLIMALGYFWNGLVDQPGKWYFILALINIAAAALCYASDSFAAVQYLIAAIVGAWSMVCLWAFRSDAY